METTQNSNTERGDVRSIDCSTFNLQPWQTEMVRRALSGEEIKLGGRGKRGRSLEELALSLASAKVNEISEKIHDTEVLLGSLTVALKEWTYIRDDLSNIKMTDGL
jgi:hypothetical protein